MKDLICAKYIEGDGSVTLSLQDFGITVNESNFEKAVESIINELKEYVEDYLRDPEYWSTDKERVSQVLKLFDISIDNLNIKEGIEMDIEMDKDKQYKAWEIIKMCQEDELKNNSIIIGKNFKEKVSDLRKQNISIDDLLISEPFTIKQIANEDVGLLFNNLKKLKENKIEFCIEEVTKNHSEIKTIAELNTILKEKIDDYYNDALDWN